MLSKHTDSVYIWCGFCIKYITLYLHIYSILYAQKKNQLQCKPFFFFRKKNRHNHAYVSMCVYGVGGDGIGYPKQDKCWYLLFQCLFNVPSTIYPRRIRNIFSASALIFSFSAFFVLFFFKVVCDDWMQFVHVWCECVFVWMDLKT